MLPTISVARLYPPPHRRRSAHSRCRGRGTVAAAQVVTARMPTVTAAAAPLTDGRAPTIERAIDTAAAGEAGATTMTRTMVVQAARDLVVVNPAVVAVRAAAGTMTPRSGATRAAAAAAAAAANGGMAGRPPIRRDRGAEVTTGLFLRAAAVPAAPASLSISPPPLHLRPTFLPQHHRRMQQHPHWLPASLQWAGPLRGGVTMTPSLPAGRVRRRS